MVSASSCGHQLRSSQDAVPDGPGSVSPSWNLKILLQVDCKYYLGLALGIEPGRGIAASSGRLGKLFKALTQKNSPLTMTGVGDMDEVSTSVRHCVCRHHSHPSMMKGMDGRVIKASALLSQPRRGVARQSFKRAACRQHSNKETHAIFHIFSSLHAGMQPTPCVHHPAL